MTCGCWRWAYASGSEPARYDVLPIPITEGRFSNMDLAQGRHRAARAHHAGRAQAQFGAVQHHRYGVGAGEGGVAAAVGKSPVVCFPSSGNALPACTVRHFFTTGRAGCLTSIAESMSLKKPRWQATINVWHWSGSLPVRRKPRHGGRARRSWGIFSSRKVLPSPLLWTAGMRIARMAITPRFTWARHLREYSSWISGQGNGWVSSRRAVCVSREYKNALYIDPGNNADAFFVIE